MRSLESHRDAGAYALGVLDEADAFRFEDHLTGCAHCAAAVAGFRPAARQLMLYRTATPRAVHPMAGPGPRFLDRLLAEVTARHRAARRRLWCAAVAAAVCVAAAPGAALLAARGDGAVRVAATDERSGVWARVTAENRPWGSGVEIEVKDAAGPRACRLVAVGRDGSETTVTSWSVPRHDARPNTVRGGAALHPHEIARYEVRTAGGEKLVALDAG
ncbi:zf-HC2 domain-containing protein [Streptomyces sp. CRN 30]|uniref:zf-HC2 domain-containing protein n=1 Tax=Streptomyces sp. CRN 30 TaxID=3075613 RepID=UPI002A81111F|nr:zf-HC2 domain-containing protein [Streptomyces sp. CRN 30]